ncbi:WG repeat-containing protein [Flammeovirgaceae bacterium SG7u.111]|nr:WG repeat-containing protein [Flammeovirgaceae bacterium SG7u.132]WPO37693.1 WG repeat-containing protein [Flammeovirgaceae bacterium SG7u.111]
MKSLTLFLLFCLLTAKSIAQEQEQEANSLYPIYDENLKWGFINETGDVIIKPQYEVVGYFSSGLSPVRSGGKYGYINSNGQVIIPFKFDFAMNFSEGYALVSEDSTTKYFIDKSGNIPFKLDGISLYHGFNKGYTIGYKDYNSVLIDTDGKLVYNKKKIDRYNKKKRKTNSVKRNLIFMCDEKFCGYLNKDSVKIWKIPKRTTLSEFNIDYKTSGFFYAFSSPKERCYGCGRSSNFLKSIKNPIDSIEENKPVLKVIDNEIDTFYTYTNLYKGHKVYLYNTTKDTLIISAQDSRLYIKVQVLNAENNWQDIDFLPSSWCGNSYHEFTFPPNTYWEFRIPKYHGSKKYKMRLSFQPKGEGDFIYSDTFEGEINPGQLWRKGEYGPSNFMDPYLY